MINRVTLVGRLTRDPEVHDTASGGQLVNMRLVTTEFRKGEDGARKEEVQYHSVVAFGRLAEVCSDYLRKGRLVYIEGKLQTREWTNKEGVKQYTTEVVANPFGGVICKVAVSGRVILQALNSGVSKLPATAGQFPQVSGLTMRVDLSAVETDSSRTPPDWPRAQADKRCWQPSEARFRSRAAPRRETAARS